MNILTEHQIGEQIPMKIFLSLAYNLYSFFFPE